jgi:vacuolar-type H+-ATPase subunit H
VDTFHSEIHSDKGDAEGEQGTQALFIDKKTALCLQSTGACGSADPPADRGDVMNDIDMLKEIKEKEEAVEKQLEQFRKEQERLLEEKKREAEERVREAEAKAKAAYEEALLKKKDEVQKKREEILEEARRKAMQLKLDLKKNELRSMVLEALNRYLEE